MMERYRFTLLGIAWSAYMVFTIVGYPFCGISVMLPSILLCGFATWLYDHKIGLLTSALSLPYNALMMMHNLESLQGWRVALEPSGVVGGITAQLLTVFFVAVLKSNQRKILKLTKSLERAIQQRNEELNEVTACIAAQSKTEHSEMSETLCNIVAFQQTGLLYQSEALMDFLVSQNAPQADAAIKLARIARQNIEEIKTLAKKVSSQKIGDTGIDQTLREMCTFFEETTEAQFFITISNQAKKIPDETVLQVYHIAREAVSNALRHGKATHIDLSLEPIGIDYTLIIENNGIPLQENIKGGIGTKLIRQRASRINATTTLETTAEGKTRFKCIFPR